MTIEKRGETAPKSAPRSGWFLFWDMHSGGGTKFPPYEKIYVEADSDEDAEAVFAERTGRDPNHCTCTCCGNDYSISYEPTFEQASGYHRGCASNDGGRTYLEEPDEGYRGKDYQTVEQYQANDNVLVIRKA